MEKASDKLYAVKRSAPLVVGENKDLGEAYVSSDPFALVGYAPRIYFPQDGVICEHVVSLGEHVLNFYELERPCIDAYP